MKRTLLALAAVAALVCASSSAWALGVSLDIPISYSFDDGGTADEVSGFKAGIALPVFPAVGIGLGYENYTVKDKDEGVESEVAFEIFDLFAEIPFPFLNLSLGLGMGTHEVTVDVLDIKEEGGVTQWFVSVGYPIVPLIDVHVGYHAVSAEELEVDVGGLSAKIDASGEMWSLGVRVGF
jgi:hypothetical protein